jgi:sigma-B regulation protein RsbU (phosphoserine phosphatase)
MPFSDLLRDLRQFDRPYPRSEAAFAAHGQAILETFLKNTAYGCGVVYLRHPLDQALRLAAKTQSLNAPTSIDFPLPAELLDQAVHRDLFAQCDLARLIEPSPETIVPLRHARDWMGVVTLGRRSEERCNGSEQLELLTAASYVLSAQLASQRMATEVREGDFQHKYRLWELESLYDIGLSIASTLDADRLAEEILIRTLALLNARRAALFLRRDDRFVLHRALGEVRAEFLDQELDQTLSQAMEHGEIINFERNANCVFPGCETFVALPIRNNDRTIGVLAVADRELRSGGVGAFEPGDIRLLSQFATQAGIALENARLHREALEKQAMERELEVAATIQRDILPRSIPSVEGFDIAALSRPARLLGGDYHAFIPREGRLSLCVADVSGKSVPAAILVSAFHAALQLLFDEERDLGAIATELNRHIHRWSAENKFITLVLATIDRSTRTVRYVNAGHNPVFVVSPQSTEALSSHGLPIGMMSDSRYAVQTRSIPPSGVLVIYSDGITEAENEAGEEFGMDRLQGVLQANSTGSCQAIRDAVSRAVDAFVGDTPRTDDQTLVLVRLT